MSETIAAIAGLWPLALITFLFAGMLIFKRQIGALMQRLSKVSMKRGQNEFVIEGTEQEPAVVGELPAPATSEPPLQIEAPKELLVDRSEESPFNAMWTAISEHRFRDAKTSFERAQAAEQDANSKLRIEVFYHGFLYAEGSTDASIPRIEEIASANPEIRAFSLGWASWAYGKVGAAEKALDAIRRAISSSDNDDERVEHTITLAKMHQNTGELDQAMALIGSSLAISVGTDIQVQLYRALASMWKDRGDKLMQAIALEKAVELMPNDRNLRFEAAYAESEADLSHLASANYVALIDQEPESSATEMNNLGVEANRFKLPIKSVALYRSAAKDGDSTLATANLAYKLLNEGFIDDARDLLKEACKRDHVHQNVNAALVEASRREAAEIETWTGILKQGVAHRLFLHEFADARFRPHVGSSLFAGSWKTTDGTTFQIEEDSGGEISGAWGTEGRTFLTADGRRRLEGPRVNRSVLGLLRKWSQPMFSTAGGHFDAGSKALAFVSSDGAHLEVLTIDQDSPQTMRFTRVRGSELPPIEG